jgi:hypothetical protein
MEAHVHCLWFIRFILWLITPPAVKLLVWIGVHGCGWPILVSICLKYATSFAFKYRAPSSASAAYDITALMIVAMVRIAPLLGGNSSSLDRKKCPPLSAQQFLFVAVSCIIVYCKDHFACFVCKFRFVLHCTII